MPRKRRQGKIPTPAWEQHHSPLTSRFMGRSPQFYGLVGAVMLVIAAFGVIGYAVLSDYLEDRNRPDSTAVRVEEAKYNLRYLTSRVKTFVQQSGGSGAVQPQTAITQTIDDVVQEEVLRRFANEESVAASEDDVKTQIATRLNLQQGKDDPNFEARLQEELTSSGLSETQFRDIAAAAVIREKLLEKFTAEVPANAEGIHFRQIVVQDKAAADAIKKEIDDGGDFAGLAKAKSLDAASKEEGGDVGWVVRGILETKLEEQLFGQELNTIVVYPTENAAYVFQVTEKDPNRALEEGDKSTLAQRKLLEWLRGKREGLKIEEFVTGDFDNYQYVAERAFPQA